MTASWRHEKLYNFELHPLTKKKKNNLHHTSAIELCELVLVDTVINHLDPHLNNRGMWIGCLCFSPCTECWQRWRVQKPSETWWKTPKSRHGTIEPRQWWRGTREPTGRETSPANSGCGQRGCSCCPPSPSGVQLWTLSVNCDNVFEGESELFIDLNMIKCQIYNLNSTNHVYVIKYVCYDLCGCVYDLCECFSK